MPRKAVRQRLHDDVSVWYLDGIVDEPTREYLRERYLSQRAGWIGIIKYTGVIGGLIAFFGILGMFATMTESMIVTALLLAVTGAALVKWGIRLDASVPARFTVSSKIVLTLGALLGVGSVVTLVAWMGVEEEMLALISGFICIPIAFYLSYKYRNNYLLILSILSSFRWIGAWHAMLGRSSYVFALYDPVTISLVALAAIAVGIYHERCLYPRTGGFYRVWEALGLLYVNMALLQLTIQVDCTIARVVWILIFTVAGIAQIVAGAVLSNSLFGNFGMVFYCINIFTRYHEFLWDALAGGWFFLLGGLLMFLCGAGVENGVRQYRKRGLR
jgi:hypothetical protein